MSKKKNRKFGVGFRSSDGRKAALQLSIKGRRLEMWAEVEGSNKLKKISETSVVGVTMVPEADITALGHFFDILNS